MQREILAAVRKQSKSQNERYKPMIQSAEIVE